MSGDIGTRGIWRKSVLSLHVAVTYRQRGHHYTIYTCCHFADNVESTTASSVIQMFSFFREWDTHIICKMLQAY